MKKKFLGLDLWQWILVFTLILLEKFNLITFEHSIIIIVVTTGLEEILLEVIKIRKCLEKLLLPPQHINCRHSITPDFKNEEAE